MATGGLIIVSVLLAVHVDRDRLGRPTKPGLTRAALLRSSGGTGSLSYESMSVLVEGSRMDDWLPQALRFTTRIIEICGIAIIVLGTFGATLVVLWQLLRGQRGEKVFSLYRSNLGRAILLGLEFLVAADIINTVAIEPSLQSLLILGGIVLIRTFLSFSLEVEIEGRWPWERHRSERRDNGSTNRNLGS